MENIGPSCNSDLSLLIVTDILMANIAFPFKKDNWVKLCKSTTVTTVVYN